MSDNHHEEAHTGPIKTPKQLLLAVAYSFILPVFIIIGLVYFVTSDNKPQAGSTNASESVAARIQKVGSVEIKSANAEPRSGEEVFKGQCLLEGACVFWLKTPQAADDQAASASHSGVCDTMMMMS